MAAKPNAQVQLVVFIIENVGEVRAVRRIETCNLCAKTLSRLYERRDSNAQKSKCS